MNGTVSKCHHQWFRYFFCFLKNDIPAEFASAVVIQLRLDKQLVRNRMKNSLIKNYAICLLFFYILFIVWPGGCAQPYPIVCRKFERSGSSFGSQIKAKTFGKFLTHTQRKLFYPGKVKRHRKKKTLFNLLKTRAKNCSDQPENFRTASVSEKNEKKICSPAGLLSHFCIYFRALSQVWILAV